MIFFKAEKYTGTGTSIKKAQHAAAKKVIDNCETLDRPKYKPKRPKSINMGKLKLSRTRFKVNKIFELNFQTP